MRPWEVARALDDAQAALGWEGMALSYEMRTTYFPRESRIDLVLCLEATPFGKAAALRERYAALLDRFSPALGDAVVERGYEWREGTAYGMACTRLVGHLTIWLKAGR